MVDKFDLAYKFVADWEGGLTDDPADRGGITHYGVSFEFLRDCARIDASHCLHLGIEEPITRETIKALTKDQAKALFRWRFWDTPGFERYQTPLAVTLCDVSVNSGVKRAILLAQKAHNKVCHDPAAWLVVDGIQGPKTRAALSKDDAVALAKAIVVERRAFYKAIVANNSSQRKFLGGWLNRADALDQYIDELEGME